MSNRIKTDITALPSNIESKIEKVPNSGCWIWTGAIGGKGYGQIGWMGKVELAHRVVYELYKGSIPSDYCVLHRCDVRCCVNPEHLFLGTKRDNTRDALKKGKFRERGGGTKPKNIDKERITELRNRGLSLRAIAQELGCSYSTIWRRLMRKPEEISR